MRENEVKKDRAQVQENLCQKNHKQLIIEKIKSF